MKNKLKILLYILFLNSVLFAQKEKIYYAEIEGDIDLGLVPFIERVIIEAEENNAVYIIFKVNTFGGRVDAATKIKDAILNSKVKTIAFVDKRAISAGALISISCNEIVMAKGSSIGAATVVDATGNKVSEKAQSYMRSEMRSTAEKNGRRTDIAEAMVDERVIIEGLVDSTQLLTLTYNQAIDYGYAEHIVEDFNELSTVYNLSNYEIISVDANWAEDVVRFLNHPIISSLLIMLGLLGLYAEIKTPGWGIAGTVGLISLALFFGSGYILEIASILEILLFAVGAILLIVEIFVIPGFGIVGGIGILMMVIALFLGLISEFPIIDGEIIRQALIQLSFSLAGGLISIYILSKFLPRTQMWNKLILQDNIDGHSGYSSAKSEFRHLLNAEGEALTVLRPSGTALINDKKIDVVTDGDFIDKGSKIKVVEIEGSKIVVTKI